MKYVLIGCVRLSQKMLLQPKKTAHKYNVPKQTQHTTHDNTEHRGK